MREGIKRREYVKLTAASVAGVALAGCSGGGDGGDGPESVDLPSITNRSGPGSENGVPIADAEEDLIEYINQEDVISTDLEYHSRDAAYDPTEILNVYQSFKDEYEPGLIMGDGSPSGHTLAERIATDEILQVIPFGTLSPSVGIENSYHVTASTGYITQNRVALEMIAEEDPGARVNLIVPPGNPAGVESAPALEYADDIDLEKGEVMDHPLSAASADSIIQRCRQDEVDWVVHTTGAPAHTVVLSSIDEIYPELNAVGVGPACTERRIAQSQDLYEGTFWVSSFKTFSEVANGDTAGADVLRTVFEDYQDTSLEEVPVETGVVDYVRGMAVVDLVRRIFEITIERGADPTSGPELRESLFQVEDFEGWGTMAPRTYTEEDPRGTMTCRGYRGEGGEWSLMDTYTLERTDEWLPSEVL
jgi:branched-chain amino acid transport system substrate-binding protein